MTRPRSRVTLCNTVTLLPSSQPRGSAPSLGLPALCNTACCVKLYPSLPGSIMQSAAVTPPHPPPPRHDLNCYCFILNCHLEPSRACARYRLLRPGARQRRVIYADLEWRKAGVEACQPAHCNSRLIGPIMPKMWLRAHPLPCFCT